MGSRERRHVPGCRRGKLAQRSDRRPRPAIGASRSRGASHAKRKTSNKDDERTGSSDVGSTKNSDAPVIDGGQPATVTLNRLEMSEQVLKFREARRRLVRTYRLKTFP